VLTWLPAVAVTAFFASSSEDSLKDFGPGTQRRLPAEFIETPSSFQGAAAVWELLDESESRGGSKRRPARGQKAPRYAG
jgi:hypothetical protein